MLIVSNAHQSDIDSRKLSEDDDGDNESFQPRVKRRRDMTAKDLDIGDLINTNMFQNKKILEMTKMLNTMKDAIAFTE